jgi:hypothetical protein
MFTRTTYSRGESSLRIGNVAWQQWRTRWMEFSLQHGRWPGNYRSPHHADLVKYHRAPQSPLLRDCDDTVYYGRYWWLPVVDAKFLYALNRLSIYLSNCLFLYVYVYISFSPRNIAFRRRDDPAETGRHYPDENSAGFAVQRCVIICT